ncbi:hypothetical protein L198_05912 [Cryptococcus wingfieldii CBS 7118]|uniref:Uncharacterized protein n=1 Tax=Cryptococcus wingfieldii CBS 7118 TaxID=1295528 RepID=A0A1E3IS89_9TREE|nr:hypothetical protein L198_05912 [Cryptococcus wingfieldii CBS 7118]ODN91398.1 hypothetical protein L198_05912 [Cryptococcus wingfieldii CBS 7118]
MSYRITDYGGQPPQTGSSPLNTPSTTLPAPPNVPGAALPPPVEQQLVTTFRDDPESWIKALDMFRSLQTSFAAVSLQFLRSAFLDIHLQGYVNFKSWSDKLKDLCVRHKVYDVLSGEDIDPQWPRDSDEHDELVYAIILNSLDPYFRRRLPPHFQAYDKMRVDRSQIYPYSKILYTHLEAECRSPMSFADQNRTMDAIFSTKLADQGDAVQHIIRLMDKNQSLEGSGLPIPQNVLCHAIINSLPPAYDGVLRHLESEHRRDTSTITLSYVIGEVEEHYYRLQTVATPPTAVAPSTAKAHTASRKPKVFCKYHRFNLSHTTKDCKKLNAQESLDAPGVSTR